MAIAYERDCDESFSEALNAEIEWLNKCSRRKRGRTLRTTGVNASEINRTDSFNKAHRSEARVTLNALSMGFGNETNVRVALTTKKKINSIDLLSMWR